MKLTSALSVRHLIARLHPPLSQSPRESQQLLSVLQSSFKRQLDDVHPPPRASDPLESAFGGPQLAGNASAEATNRLLQSVLDHPLLDQDAKGYVGLLPASKDASALFDNALLHNKVDLHIVDSCLKLYANERKVGRGHVTANNLGRKVAAWVSSLKSVKQVEIWSNTNFMSRLMPMMYQGALERVIWEWLKNLYEADLRTNAGLQAEDNFVALMLRESIRRNDLTGAVQEFVQACEYRAISGRAAVEPNQGQQGLHTRFLRQSWRIVSFAISRKRFGHRLTTTHFDRLLDFAVPFSVSHAPDGSFLQLYHPKSPTAYSLHKTLTSPGFKKELSRWAKSSPEYHQRTFLISILDGAEMALNQSGQERSRVFLEFAEEHFPSFISSNPTQELSTRIDHAREEVMDHTFPTFPAIA